MGFEHSQFAFICRGVGAVAGPSLLSGLVSWHGLEEASGTRADSHGDNDLTDNNTVTQVVGGGPGGQDCAQFTAANNESLSITDAAQVGLEPDNANWTESVWVWFDSVASNQVFASKHNNTSDQREFMLRFTDADDSIRVFWSTDGVSQSNLSFESLTVTAGVWHHVIWWHDAGNDEIGLTVDNGTPVTVAEASGIFTGTAGFRLGAKDEPEQFLDGRLWGHGAWNRVLTTQEHTDLFGGGAGFAYPFDGEPPDGGGGETIVFETDFSTDTKNVKLTGDVLNPYDGSKEALVDSGITNKIIYQTGGDNDPHMMMIDDPTGGSGNGDVMSINGGRRNHTALQGWFGTEALSEQRMYLNSDHNLFGGGIAYMMEEWKVRFVEGSSFRIMFRPIRDGAGEQWGWKIHGETAASDIISEVYFDFQTFDVSVPIGKWFVKRTYFRAGDPGKIKIVIEPEGEPAAVVFDLDIRTDSPHVAEVRSCQEYYPQMMYPSVSKSQSIVDQGGVIRQYYDWWRLSIPGSEPV